jgi:hypothetical protein
MAKLRLFNFAMSLDGYGAEPQRHRRDVPSVAGVTDADVCDE